MYYKCCYVEKEVFCPVQHAGGYPCQEHAACSSEVITWRYLGISVDLGMPGNIWGFQVVLPVSRVCK